MSQIIAVSSTLAAGLCITLGARKYHLGKKRLLYNRAAVGIKKISVIMRLGYDIAYRFSNELHFQAYNMENGMSLHTNQH